MRKHSSLLAGVLALILPLALTAGLSTAQEPVPAVKAQPQGLASVEAMVDGRIPIQGRLTDASGTPLTGNYSVRFRLYDAASGGTVLCEDTHTVNVSNGLFSTEMDGCTPSDINGTQLYLGIQVGSDAEMTPRQPIYPVPYAFSLVPGAVISATSTSAVLNVYNHGNGWGLDAYSKGHDAVHGRSDAGNHAGVSGENTGGGIGVYGYSNTGTAIRAAGSGIIQSSAKSNIWISGNGVRPFHQGDSTIIDMDTIGGAKVYRGATVGYKNVMLPITVPGTLYGQDVKISAMDIYWVGDTDMDAITAVLMRRQTGVCASSSCYATILHDTADHVCDDGNNPTGCPLHYDLTSNNVLTADSGILYLTLELGFSGASTWIEIGGVRLTLEHD